MTGAAQLKENYNMNEAGLVDLQLHGISESVETILFVSTTAALFWLLARYLR